MSDKKTKGEYVLGVDLASESDKLTVVKCNLTTRGTQEANIKVIDDLTIPDPEPAIGKQIIKEAVEDEIEDDSQSDNS